MNKQTPHQTLPARYYTDAEFFQEELKRFYCQMWSWAGRSDQIPNAGDYFLREVAGESILIARDKSGTLRAFYNVCRNRGTRMCVAVEGLTGHIVCQKFPYRIPQHRS